MVGLLDWQASKGAFICALFMVVTPAVSPTGLAGQAAKDKGVPLTTWAGVAAALCGTALLETAGMDWGALLSGGGGGSGGLSINSGDLWCLGTATGFGLMFARST